MTAQTMYDRLTDKQKGIVVREMRELQAWYCLTWGYSWTKAHEMEEKHRDRIISEVFDGTFKTQFPVRC